jgi:hypothetical protein
MFSSDHLCQYWVGYNSALTRLMAQKDLSTFISRKIFESCLREYLVETLPLKHWNSYTVFAVIHFLSWISPDYMNIRACHHMAIYLISRHYQSHIAVTLWLGHSHPETKLSAFILLKVSTYLQTISWKFHSVIHLVIFHIQTYISCKVLLRILIFGQSFVIIIFKILLAVVMFLFEIFHRCVINICTVLDIWGTQF